MRTRFSYPGGRAALTSRKGDATTRPEDEPAWRYLLFAACLGVAVLLTVIAEHIEPSDRQYSSAGASPFKATGSPVSKMSLCCSATPR
ncbi:MAG: hypothetical protein H6R15_3172 [Proteobacteria bacterium]|nr:hypothetical protein [Pseudomonadota bacterium]